MVVFAKIQLAVPPAGIPIPEVPDVPLVPVVPEVPEVPDVPVVPEVPDVPSTPEVPDVPEDPSPPAAPSKFTINIELGEVPVIVPVVVTPTMDICPFPELYDDTVPCM